MTEFYEKVVALLELPKHEFARKKIKLCKELGLTHIPSDAEIIAHIGKQKNFVGKPVRTMSGVAPVAIMTIPYNCPHGRCTFCPGGIKSPFGDVPQSYTGHEPATLRAIRNNYDAYLQVMNRLQQYHLLGHNHDKVELIIMGGTFPAMESDYQKNFVTYALKAMNDFEKINDFNSFFELFQNEKDRFIRVQQKLLHMKNESTLETEKLRNETAKIRCVGLTIETKPDWGMLEHANQMLELGCTRVEVGIQSVYEEVLKHTHRGHSFEQTKECIRTLKDLGLKITGHYMPGLPLTTKEMDVKGMKQLFDNPDLRVDQLKIYPAMVSKGTPLWRDWKEGRFTPLTTKEAIEIITEFKKHVPEYCRIMRVQRDVPTKWWEAGVGCTNLRQIIQEAKPRCRCIRCREPKGRSTNSCEIIVREYDASKGKEFFISVEDKEQDILLGFIRLRFPSQQLRKEITTETAIVRELHVYGQATEIGQQGTVQHRGFGKMLLAKAEEIAKQHGKNKMVITSAIGVREYYYKQAYSKQGPYVIKYIQ